MELVHNSLGRLPSKLSYDNCNFGQSTTLVMRHFDECIHHNAGIFTGGRHSHTKVYSSRAQEKTRRLTVIFPADSNLLHFKSETQNQSLITLILMLFIPNLTLTHSFGNYVRRNHRHRKRGTTGRQMPVHRCTTCVQPVYKKSAV